MNDAAVFARISGGYFDRAACAPAFAHAMREEMEMKAHKITAAVIGSFMLGAGAASVLQAQTNKPPAYIVGEIEVKDQDGYKNEFLPKALALIKENGGKIIAGGYNKTVTIEGQDPPNRYVIYQYPDIDAVKKYGPLQVALNKELGSKYANFRLIGVDGVEMK